ncbi:head assembly [Pseudomonas phage PPPL-1]|uniref:Capsid assembly protein n=1 Tax=Pseudomonas phage PPPL-1 TaxID=1755692 RepID=A0A0S2MVN9_9CAUD|nr:head assembly [Pseudomonas phage PPPL-1]ALO79995.1 capsid assembly protein [Pseudomonas phage PPPL-1]
MSDIYAEFGVNGAVMSSNNITEHEQNMLSLPTSVRDGDDAITLAAEEQGDEQDLDQGTDEQGEGSEQENEDQAQEEDGSDSDDFTPLGEPDAELVASSQELDEYAEGFQQLRAQAIKQGLDASVADAIEAEYEADNKLSEASLKALEAVGYSRGFVRSFIAGQEAVATKYVQQIQAFAGGADKFAQVISHLSANSPDAVAALEDAMGRQDLAAVKTIINLGMQSRSKKFGKAPERAVNKRASAPVVSAKGPQGFASQREMIAAMSDKRYQDDADYRRSVEAKVGASSW